MFVPTTVLIIPANLLAGRLTGWYGARRTMVLGQLLMTSGLLGLCSADAGVALWVVIGWLQPTGVGAGLVAPAMTTMMLDGMPAERGGFGAGPTEREPPGRQWCLRRAVRHAPQRRWQLRHRLAGEPAARRRRGGSQRDPRFPAMGLTVPDRRTQRSVRSEKLEPCRH
ncbi:MAG TPA: hypothetical protein VGD71_31795 [Kribbella sp.]